MIQIQYPEDTDFNMDECIFSKIIKENINLSVNGFVRKHHGIGIDIFYVENKSVVYMDGELSGVPQYDFLIYAEIQHIKKRYYPDSKKIEEIPLNERFEIQNKLISWLENEKIRNDIERGV